MRGKGGDGGECGRRESVRERKKGVKGREKESKRGGELG